MKNICLINGSLRGKKASSLEFLKDVNRRLSDMEYNKTFITVRAGLKENYPEDVLESMAGADAIILVFPLFTYGLPGALTRLLEDYYQYIKTGKGYNRDTKVYVIVNCGFPRPEITEEAIRVIKNFSSRLSINWRFAICIGSGPAVVATKRVRFQLISVITLVWLILLPYLFIYASILFLYIPLGKLRHTVYFFTSRIHLAFFYGRRGVWPLKR